MAMVAAADILGLEGPESRLVRRMLQNLHPRIKARLVFVTKLESVKDLFTLATTVAEAVAVEELRKSMTTATRQGEASRATPSSTVVTGPSLAGPNRRVRCWGCGKWGHIQPIKWRAT
jgi:hypothetical protein